jgi:four helix bundle protein
MRKHSALSTQHSAKEVSRIWKDKGEMKNFRDLNVWHKAHQLTLSTYKCTVRFPAEERFGLTSQLRRSAASVAANIAEGCGRGSNSDFHRFLQMAMGSASEAEYHFLLAHDLGYLNETDHRSLNASVTEVKRMLAALLNKVGESRSKGHSAGQ